ncbi:serine/threonine-protein kinase 16 isoform X2 [Sitophilus oryzae]|nr:serine/threonine-protein kinase 16 isoform X2 [Sitophilus oryzae]XP_030747372.1 serine/threonine-protein kinase 16 isoform X2 [Sitophilus oryzae]
MNALGLSTLLKMGCLCIRESIDINGIKYVVNERLGEGGFSCVDLVEQTSTKKKFALKRITCHSIEDQKIANQEIMYYKKLKHPNIIQLIDACIKGSADIVVQTTSEAYLLLPYYKRGTLHDYLTVRQSSTNYLDIREVLRLFLDICEAVKYLHNYSPEAIAHRDIKVANVCLTDNMDPILMDLGSCTTAKVQICGVQDAQKLQDLAAERCSMTYRAPELFHVESYCVIDQRTDIWSLGCLLYALLYFKSPYDIIYERGDSVNLAVLSGNIFFPDNTPFPQELHDIITFILKVNSAERPFIEDVIDRVTNFKRQFEFAV